MRRGVTLVTGWCKTNNSLQFHHLFTANVFFETVKSFFAVVKVFLAPVNLHFANVNAFFLNVS